jgi:hypothetical protein
MDKEICPDNWKRMPFTIVPFEFLPEVLIQSVFIPVITTQDKIIHIILQPASNNEVVSI